MLFEDCRSCVLLFCLSLLSIRAERVWKWGCIDGYCQKQRFTPGSNNPALTLAACQVTCLDYGALWPKPTGQIAISKSLVYINSNCIDIPIENHIESSISNLIQATAKRFSDKVNNHRSKITNSGQKCLDITFDISNSETTQLTLESDESYTLQVNETSENELKAIITAPTYFGARYGLETLNQLLIFDDEEEQYQIPKEILITDKPVYPYRGILLDTARNYISVQTIKRTIEGIAASKLNTLHWHMTDTQSFPYVSKSQPELSKLGAYSKKKIYSQSDVEVIIQFAKELGVRVLPELDGPAHVGEGWQDTGFVTCFNKKPWQKFCKEPPCGQFNPTIPELYDALEDLYKDIIEQFNPDLFHMGGDEVSTTCWKSTPSIVQWMNTTHGWGQNEEDFMKLWDVFQTNALGRFEKQSGKKIPIILWSSTLTDKKYVQRYLPKDRYIIQVWTTANDKQIKELLERDYKLILSNYDTLYLDCGFASWVGSGTNWCSPYKGWQKIYENSPAKIGGARKNQFLGAEAALWTEQVDDSSVDSRIWPRAAALAERLWAEPNTNWRNAEPRMLIHRKRLVDDLGIAADALQPEWCLQYEESCPNQGKFNKG